MALHPVGPLPASTYWRRRAVLLGVLVLVLLVLRSCVGGSPRATLAGRPGPSASPSPSSSSKAGTGPTLLAAPTASPTATAVGTCSDSQLQLSSRSDASTYAVGSTPRFTLSVRNTSSVACRRDLGGDAVELLVYSGSDRIWSNRDCGKHDDRSVQLLRAGASLETSVFWSGKRSAPGCTGTPVAAKAGTYTLRAAVGTLHASVIVFQLHA